MREPQLEDEIDPDDCFHPNRPANPRVDDEGKPWHCTGCDTLFVVTVLAEPIWREL